MYSQRQYYFSRFARSHPILKFINVYDRQSFIREYILDNIFICIFAYIFFYITLWYANRVIKRIEKSNQEMLITVADNRSKLSDVIALKNKRQEYEEVVMKAKGAQRITTRHLENEIKKINYELMITTDKLEALEKMLLKRTAVENARNKVFEFTQQEGECTENTNFVTDSIENVKIMEPSFPPTTPPPRKYGIFVPRPAKGRSSPPRIGFK
ncbi:uncharacterized protein LOC130666523 isoform X2 [Microplitis mediator]|uniref:uncharacterized protein LOC130666523 isoform X2 n=1 Tax=Microplitis mediator TaxID=375433 RepID=UPI002556CE6D|nr:uncharacterized protein LOC130666523 isoform X2 [Microplitis mediator]